MKKIFYIKATIITFIIVTIFITLSVLLRSCSYGRSGVAGQIQTTTMETSTTATRSTQSVTKETTERKDDSELRDLDGNKMEDESHPQPGVQ